MSSSLARATTAAAMPPGAVTPSPVKVRQAGEVRSARLESLRAVAAVSVVAAHVFGAAHGYDLRVVLGSLPKRLVFGGGNGVFLFFALSGYLLFLPFARAHWGAAPRPDLRRYARNRAVRILPLYYVVLVAFLLADGGGTLREWLRFATFTQVFAPDIVERIDGPMWSLAVEMEFYAVLPLLAWGLAKLSRRSLGAALLLLMTLGGMSLVGRLELGTQSVLWRYSPLTCFFFFTPGMALALMKAGDVGAWLSRLPAMLRRSDIWVLAGVAIYVVQVDLWRLDVLMGAASLLVLAACVLPLRRGLAVRLLETRLLAAIGVASYSLYLWHDPIVNALARQLQDGFPPLLVIAVPLCLALAALSYRLVERPFLQLRRAWAVTSPERLVPAA